jgi:FkbM family methyltransferase
MKMHIKQIVWGLLESVIPRKMLFIVGKRMADDASGNNNDDMRKNGELHILKTIIAAHTRPEFTFFDVGANVGLWTKSFFSLYEVKSQKKINGHCFEPSGFTFKRLQEALKADPRTSNVEMHNVALSNSSTTLTLFINQEGAGSNSVYERQGFKNISKEIVEAKTIDAFCEQNKITQIDFIKIDVEGHEIQVLQGAQRMLQLKRIDYIQFEYGGTWIDSHTFLLDMYKYLMDFGYKVGKILPRGLETYDQYDSRLDTFQLANFLAYLPEKERQFKRYHPCWAK